MYGPSGRIAVGGTGHDKDEEDDEEEKTIAQPRTADSIEPASFAASSVEFYEDLYDWQRAKVVINLTSVDVNAAMAAIRSKLSYVGIVWTDAHKEMFVAEMIQQVFANFQDESSPLYQAELVQILGRTTKKPKKASGRVGVRDLGLRSASSSKLH